MPELVFTPAANADLIAIAEHIEQQTGSLASAERYAGRILAKCTALASVASIMGRPRQELLPELRSVPFGNYLIFIRYMPSIDRPDQLEIVNIVHASRDIGEMFKKRT